MAGYSYHDSNYDPGVFNVYFTQDPSTGVCTNIAITCQFGTAGVLNCYSRTQTFRCELQLLFADANKVVSIGTNWPNPQPAGNGYGPDNSGDHHVDLGSWTYTPTTSELQNGQLNIEAWAVTIDDTGTRAPGNCSGYINVTHHFTPPDSTPPTISFTTPSGTNPSDSSGSPITFFKEVADASASITVTISDSGSGPKQFLYRINEYEFDGSTIVGGTSGPWETETGSSKTIPLSEEAIYEVEVKEAEDVAGNKSSGIEPSGKFIITNEEVTVDDAPTPVTVTPGCKDFWATGFPQTGIVTLDDLKTSSKVIDKIKEVYGMADAEITQLWTWHTDMFALPPSDSMHASIASAEYAGSSSNAFASPDGALTGRSGGWFSGLYGRGHNGSSSYTAGWLGRRSSGAPQPVLEHLSIYGEFWGYSTYGGWNTGIPGIRGRGTDGSGKAQNMHRRRDQFIMDAVAAWAPGSTFPTSSHSSAAAYSGQPCGIDRFLAGLDIVPQGGGTFKIEDCIAPTDVNVSVASATVLAGGKEYYVDYPNTGHVCHFEVEATDMEYGLKEAIFTPVLDGTPGTPETIAFPGAPYQGTATAGPFEVDTEGSLEISVEVEVFDEAGNSTTETLSPLDISIDDGEPQGGTVSGSGQTNASNSTTTPGLKLVDPGWMVSSKPYYDSKTVEIMVEYEDEYSGVDEAKLYINGTVESTVTLPSTITAEVHNQTYTITNSNLVEGINNAQLWLKDLATNEWFSNTLDFYIDETKPVCFIDFSTQDTILQNNSKYWTKENSINVDLTYDDVGPDPSGIDQGLIVVNGSAPTSVSDFSMSLSGTSKTGHTVSSLTVGQNDIDFYTIDKTENISNKNTITVWVDQTDAIGTMTRAESISTYSDDKIYTNTNKFDVNLTMTESDSGLF